jgi:Uma2 family endonuclease
MLDVPHQYIIHSYYHQSVVAHLIRKIGNYLASDVKWWAWEVLPAIKIDESATSPVPDISICTDLTPEVIIEITDPVAVNSEFKKLSRLIENYEFGEGFIYDYKKHTWKKYKLGVGEITENPSFCDAIGYDLNDFLK